MNILKKKMDNNEQSSKNEIFVPKKIENKILINYNKKHKKKRKSKRSRFKKL